MKFRLLAAMVGAVCSLSCYSSDGYYGPPAGDQPFSCEQLTSCATCTPVLGCGWCQSGDKGLCTSDPDRCAGVASFSWTWEPAFCPAAPDGGADAWVGTPPDGAATSDGGDRASDAGPHE
jgi:hypothetical protein